MRAEERRLGGDLGGQAQAPRLVVDGEAVAALHLDRRRALPRASPRRVRPGGRAGRRRRRPGRGDGGRDPAAVVPGPRHPGLELAGPVAGEDQVRVGVDETGDDGPPPDVDPGVGVRRGGRRADPGDGPVLDDQRGAGDEPSGPSPRVGSLVTSSPMPVTSVLIASAQSGSIAADSSRPTSPRRCCPLGHHHPAVDDHGVHVRRAGRHHDLAWRAAGGARAVQADGDQVGSHAGGEPAGVGPAQRAVPVDGQRVDEIRRPEAAALAGGQPLVRPPAARASANRSVTTCWSLPTHSGDPASRQPAERADAVGEVGLGARARADRGARRAEDRDVLVGRGGWRARRSVAGRARRAPRAAGSGCSRRTPGRPRSRPAARTGARAAAARRRPRRRPPAAGAGTARTEWTAAPTRTPSAARAAARPGPPTRRRRRRRTGAARRRAAGGRPRRGRRPGSRCRAA